MRKRGTPVTAQSIQSHLGRKYSEASTGLGPIDKAAWRRFLDSVTGMGLALLVTKLDVHAKPLPSAIGMRDREVAAHTCAYLDLTLSYPQCRTVMCWGLSDRYSWLLPLRLRPDGLPKRPLPYNYDFAPKLMRDAIAAAFAAVGPRTPTHG